jgi:type IV secretory pathway VirB2 component (pilin)
MRSDLGAMGPRFVPVQTTTQTGVRKVSSRNRVHLAFALAVGAVAAIPSLSWAQPLVSEAQQISTWGLSLIKVLAVLFIIAGFISFATGRHHWAGGLAVAIGVIGAAKADTIASYLGLG